MKLATSVIETRMTSPRSRLLEMNVYVSAQARASMVS